MMVVVACLPLRLEAAVCDPDEVLFVSAAVASEGGGISRAAARAVSEGPFCYARSIDILIAVRSMTRTEDREVYTCCGGEMPSSGG